MLDVLRRRILAQAETLGYKLPARPGKPMPLRVVEEAGRDLDAVMQSLLTTPDGLSDVEAMVRRAKEGFNEVAHEKPPRWYVQLLHAFRNPFIALLLSLATLSLITADYKAATVIAVMVAISVVRRSSPN
jgi:P-type Mg2+ transporter